MNPAWGVLCLCVAVLTGDAGAAVAVFVIWALGAVLLA